MSKWRIDKAIASAMRRYRRDIRGTMSVELVLVLPILFWGYVAMMVFYDAYRARMEAQSAALHVADLMSRQSNMVTTSYLEGLNDVYDFLTSRNRATRLRISSLMWVEDSDDPAIAWSYGTRGLPSLLDLSLGYLGGVGDGEESAPIGFDILDNQMPVADLADRIPQVLPGEALILVEAFTLWRSPIISWFGFDYLNNVRLAPIAVTRPRFSPFIRYEGDNDVFPDGLPETEPEVGTPPPPEDDDDDDLPANHVVVTDTDFTDGDSSGWSAGSVTHTRTSAGSFLGPYGGETRNAPVTRFIGLGETSERARIEFDLFIIDSWDGYSQQWAFPEGEALRILVNGTAIASEAFQVDPQGMMREDRRTVASRAEGRFTTTMTPVQTDSNIWGNGWNDQIWRVVIDIENPSQNFVLGFSANLNEPIHNESFGLMNFRVAAVRGSHGPQHFVPNASAWTGTDSLTRFATYSGCPNPDIPAQHLTLHNSDLSQTVRMRRNVGRSTWINNCNIPGGFRYMDASPTMVLDYTNDTANINGNRLRIRAEDFNSGYTCDSTIAVLDPSGMWMFVDDLPGYGWNAGVNLGNAQSGKYTIWLGNYNTNVCHTELIFERY